MKLLLIDAIDNQRAVETSMPTLGLGYLASAIRKAGLHVDLKITDNVNEVRTWKPDMVGITSTSQNYDKAIGYTRAIKDFDVNLPVIIGGVHISALPQTMNAGMDVAVLGEGEQTIVELLRLYLSSGKFDKESLCGINGIAFWYRGKIETTPHRAMIQPLDFIPFPARDLLTIKKSTSILTSRGCPYKCTFCFSTRFWNKVRFFSSEYVVSEIELLYKHYGVRHIHFMDDLFIANKPRLIAIVELLGKSNLLGKVSFNCSARSDLITEDIARLLRQMNVKAVRIGMESGCQETLEYLKGKDSITVSDHVKAIEILRKHHIFVGASFIIGSPQEGRESILQTKKFIEDTKVAFELCILTPFPGTPIWDNALSRGLVSNTMDWDRLNVSPSSNSNPVIVSEKLTKEEIMSLYSNIEEVRKFPVSQLVKSGLKNPLAIPSYVKRKLCRRLI